MFKAGDLVRCVNADGYFSIVEGKVYKVLSNNDCCGSIEIVNGIGNVAPYSNYQFELVIKKENTVTTEKKPRKHRDLIIAWANGATVQSKIDDDLWHDERYPDWDEGFEYRIKPEKKPDQSRTMFVELHPKLDNAFNKPNLKLTFDGETGKLKAVEIISE